ncbi:hypothetical protein MMC06_006071 [Schaereria dolodes]|nr:hypothetical protein [Schaereria dolodes]
MTGSYSDDTEKNSGNDWDDLFNDELNPETTMEDSSSQYPDPTLYGVDAMNRTRQPFADSVTFEEFMRQYDDELPVPGSLPSLSPNTIEAISQDPNVFIKDERSQTRPEKGSSITNIRRWNPTSLQSMDDSVTDITQREPNSRPPISPSPILLPIAPPRSIWATTNLRNHPNYYDPNVQIMVDPSFLLWGSKTPPQDHDRDELALSSEEGDSENPEPKRRRVNRAASANIRHVVVDVPDAIPEQVSKQNAHQLVSGALGAIPRQTHEQISHQPTRGIFGAAPTQTQAQTQALTKAQIPEPPVPTLRHIDLRPRERIQPLIRYETERDAKKPWVKAAPNKGMNTRSATLARYKAEEMYNRLPNPPDNWASFQYTAEGELEPRRVYTTAEIEYYLSWHPLHGSGDNVDSKHSGLTLWIQRNPADSARRYPAEDSSRCRFKDCYAPPRNTINQGQYRVAFDEQSYKDANNDPQHNAGYVHLYCLEKHLDFPKLCETLNVKAEDRSLPHEPGSRNRMLMATPEELQATQEFIRRCEERQGQPPEGYPPFNMTNRPHEGTLTHQLSVIKTENQPRAIQTAREKRGEKNSVLSKHLGNLELETAERAVTRKAENQNWPLTATGKRKRKPTRPRRTNIRDSSGDGDDDEYIP